MQSNYNPQSTSESFDQWLEQITNELREFGHLKELSPKELAWFYNTWQSYDLSPAEAVQSFFNETSDE